MKKYLDIPFVEKGREFSGCDCWGLVVLFFKTEFGINIEDHSAEYKDVHDLQSIAGISAKEKDRWIKVEGNPQRGDVAEICWGRNNYHVGIVPTAGYLLHIEEGTTARIVPLRSERIKRRIINFWRHVGAG